MLRDAKYCSTIFEDFTKLCCCSRVLKFNDHVVDVFSTTNIWLGRPHPDFCKAREVHEHSESDVPKKIFDVTRGQTGMKITVEMHEQAMSQETTGLGALCVLSPAGKQVLSPSECMGYKGV